MREIQSYQAKKTELEAYLTGYWLTDLANFSSFVFHSIPDLNWCGFYLHDGQKLRLGPFMGRPACMEIRPGRGVCGTAFSDKRAMIVPNVDEFPGHIVCDGASRSELVLPLMSEGECIGVLDLDSPSLGRFTELERDGISHWVEVLLKVSKSLREKPWIERQAL